MPIHLGNKKKYISPIKCRKFNVIYNIIHNHTITEIWIFLANSLPRVNMLISNEIFGHQLKKKWSLWHSSDLMRILVLRQFGGIYLDRDVYVVGPLNELFKYEMTLDCDESGVDGHSINGVTLIAPNNARYLRKWHAAFRLHFGL